MIEEAALKRREDLATLAPMNRLLFGDNLRWLRDAKLFPGASVDLVYLNGNSYSVFQVLRIEKMS